MSNGAAPVTAVITLCSMPRVAHVSRQLRALADADVSRVVVWIGADAPPALDAERVITVPPGREGLRLAAARNAGASIALASGAELLVFLDADCVPGAELLPRYQAAHLGAPDAVLCGPVTYLPPDADASDSAALVRLTAPHPARPAPPSGRVRPAVVEEYALFWSLSFAAGAACWKRSGGFDERYEGYGGEDTDFAFRLRREGIPLIWVGGAHAYHQHHAVETPPWGHLDDILRNGALFAHTWGEWPMTGWLEEFARAGAVRRTDDGWERTAAH